MQVNYDSVLQLLLKVALEDIFDVWYFLILMLLLKLKELYKS